MNYLSKKQEHSEALADTFKLLGDPTRLRVVLACLGKERSVGQIAAAAELSLALASHHLRLLKATGLVNAERRGKYVYYRVSDPHIAHMLGDMLDHAKYCLTANQKEPAPLRVAGRGRKQNRLQGVRKMENCNKHANHAHQHGPNCGHTAIKHAGHIDYLHDGHLHHVHGDHVDEHVIEVSGTNPDKCNNVSTGHDKSHRHGPACGHEAVPHGDHTDFLVQGRLHHVHDDHCDDHGPVELVKA